MIEIKQLTKIFEGERAVDDVSLTVHKGSIFGLLGSNGAGKTTLLKTVAGIYRADRGQVLLEGQPIYEHPGSKQRMIFLADQPYFFAQTSIKQMAVFYRAMYPNWDEQRFQQLAQAFKTIPLKRKLHRLSKGMQRQASLWLALSCKPDVLILDEPIDGLDPVMRRQVKNLLFQEVADRELTVIISSHNLREIEDMCDHVGIMHQGRLLIEKELDDLKAASHKIQIAFRDPRHEQAISGLLEILHKEERGSVGTYIIKGTVERITEVIQAYQPYVFDVLPMTLEEIFIYEMGDAGYDVQPLLL
ncbi:ABC transporter ATP-binding protein [Paenibacillus bovis]|uniref:ABC transporter n=1 Tax=Paenibacillus bovis TaxID=1616788 RepID=A0A172ZE66_9BACL|nr:ABC transporter ATP-binding protein [Paenibacillus bovis]ANF95819.1 ABC transporter [Paenibacillus bovis]